MSESDSARIFVPPPLIFLTGLILGLVIDGRIVVGLPDAPLWQRALAVLLMIAGVGLMVSGLRRFSKAGTRPEPWAPSSALVSSGIYRWTRNPMYLGMAVLYGGIALLFASPAAGLLLLPVLAIMNFVVIRREEAYLLRRFGAEYDAYRRQVRRWL